jgi:Mor family transcriptional regulator
MNRDIEKYDEFAKRMQERFPKMFAQPYGGFAVGPGWWTIIESLCGQIQHHVEWKQEQKEKYGNGQGCADVTVTQIKEKFGGLRFYYNGGDDIVDGMVRMAESWAAHSCEECGKPGKSRKSRWIKTLCDEHEAERQAQYKERFKHHDQP